MIQGLKSLLPQGLYAFLRDLYVSLDHLKKRLIGFLVGLTVRKNQDVRFSWRLGSGRKFVVRQRWDEPYLQHKYTGGFDCYETYRKAVETFAPQAPVIFDVGANIGMTTLVFAAVENSTVYSFEPVKRTFGYLQKNIADNALDNVKAFNFGFDESASIKQIGGTLGEVDSSSFAFLPLSDGKPPDNVYCEECTFKTLDQFVRDEAIGRIDYLKIDVEGHDVQVLKGGLKTILEYKPVLQIEVAKPTYGEHYDFPWLKNLVGQLGRVRIFFVYRDKLIEINSLDEFLAQDVIQTDIIIAPLQN